MTTPEVTVVVAARDEERLLGWCLRSVGVQRGVEWECIVVDDGSGDGTVRIARRFAARDRRFRVIGNAPSAGLAATRNAGLAEARSPFVTFLDADDYLFLGSLSRRVGVLISAPADVIGAFGDWISVPERSRRPVPGRRAARRGDVTLLTAGRTVPFIASAPVLRSSLVEAIGGFDERLRTGEDADLWSWWLRLLGRTEYTPVVAVAYRRRSGSMVLRDPAAHQERIRAAFRNLDTDIDVRHPAVLEATESWYRENAVALPRAMLAAAQAVATGDDARARALVDSIDGGVLRLAGPASAAADATTALSLRLRGTRGSRSIRRGLGSTRARLAALVDSHARPVPSEAALLEGSRVLAEQRRSGDLGVDAVIG
jgi:glycosyltransferase involved in cell wall biosynthesis